MAKRKKVVKTINWEKTPEYREAVMMKVMRALKSYGYSEWMTNELKAIGLSI